MVCNLDLKRRSYGHLKTNRAKPKREFFWFHSRTPISKGVSQLRNHPLAHECHFAASYAHFAAAKWAAKIPLLYKILPPLRKRSPSLKNGMRSSFLCFFFPFGFEMDAKWFSSFKMAMEMLQASKWAAKLPFGCEMISQPHSYPLPNPPFAAKMAFWLWNDFQTSKWAAKMFLFSLWLKNGLQKYFFFPFGFQMAVKWPPSYEMIYENTLQSQGKLRKCQQSPAPCI